MLQEREMFTIHSQTTFVLDTCIKQYSYLGPYADVVRLLAQHNFQVIKGQF